MATETRAAPLPAQTSEARALLERLAARPRPAGGEEEARARGYCCDVLHAAGFDVAERAFTYSQLPGRWGTAAAGALWIAALGAAGHLGARGHAGWSLGLLAGVAAVLSAGGAWMTRRGVLVAPVLRARGVNVEATRGGQEPRLWLVAHLDSKSQPVPIGARAAGIAASIVAWMGAVTVASAQLAGAPLAAWWSWLTVAGVLAGLPVAASVVGARSAGALDNASGVATVLLAAAALPASAPVGVLLTSAEELGLAGARAWALLRMRGGVAINCDGVDDVGRVTVMYSGRAPRALLAAARAACAEVGAAAPRSRRLLPGVLTDGVALAARGWEVVTLSKGTVGTLARIHTPADSLDALRGDGVAEAARVMAAMARGVLGEQGSGARG